MGTKKWTLKHGVEPSIFIKSLSKKYRKSPRKTLFESSTKNDNVNEDCAFLYTPEPMHFTEEPSTSYISSTICIQSLQNVPDRLTTCSQLQNCKSDSCSTDLVKFTF